MTSTARIPRPGTRDYAPQARFVDVATGAVLHGGAPADYDLISTRVTLTHDGVSNASLTLSNLRNVGGLPVDPPWKYNELDHLYFGQEIRVELGYGIEGPRPVLQARVTDLDFDFPSDGGSRLTLKADDLLSTLKIKPEEDKRYRDADELDVVADVLRRSACGLRLAPSKVKSPLFPEKLDSLTHRKSQSYLQFVQSLAERLDFEFFAEFEDPRAERPNVRVHFEPARSLELGTVVDLKWNRNLLDFHPKFKVWEQYTATVARGRHPRNREEIEERSAEDAIAPDLHAAPGGSNPISAVAARKKFFRHVQASEENVGSVHASGLGRTRAKRAAEAAFRARAREFLTAEAHTIGSIELRPGIHVNLQGLGAPFDGIYYVITTVHTVDGSGYRTQLTVRRPGMLDPEAERKRKPGGGT